MGDMMCTGLPETIRLRLEGVSVWRKENLGNAHERAFPLDSGEGANQVACLRIASNLEAP